MARAHFFLAALAILAGGFVLSGCSRSAGWVREDTRFEFGNLDSSHAPAVRRLFLDKGYTPKQVTEGDRLAFDVRGIGTTSDLSALLNDIRNYAREKRVSLPLERAILQFGELELAGSITSTITVRATRGSTVYIADGTDKRNAWRRVEPKDGKWVGQVRTDGVVADYNGWVYIMAIRDGDIRYSRINVLKRNEELDVAPPDDLTPPADVNPGALRRLFNR